MERQLHSVVENSYNFDHVAMRGPVHDEMPPASALARDMEGSKIWEDFVTSGASEHVGAVAERGKRLKERGSVNVRLLRAESLSCVFQDAGEIFLGLSTKANPPTCLRQ
jgi:hypothetical protein